VKRLAFAALLACSNGPTGAPPDDAAAPDHALADAAVVDAPEDEASSEAAPPSDAAPTVNGCTAYVDRTADAASRVIAWTYTVASDPARCMRITVGQSVTWNGDFVQHPRLAQGGDAPSPIADAGAAPEVAFPAQGTFGFACGNHPFMTGAIRVAP
jgi:plastocyanin